MRKMVESGRYFPKGFVRNKLLQISMPKLKKDCFGLYRLEAILFFDLLNTIKILIINTEVFWRYLSKPTDSEFFEALLE